MDPGLEHMRLLRWMTFLALVGLVPINGVPVPLRPTGNPDYPLRADVSISSAKTKIDLIRDR